MKLIINQIKKKLNTKSLLKIIWVFFISWFLISNSVFAQSQTTAQDWLEFFNVNLNTILSLLSWLWIFLAGIAGKLMSNERVYGSVIHLDIYLWKLRNIMKNFANFTLVALVLVEVVKIAIGQSKEGVSKIFTKTLIAAVLIQASWFVMWAVIDISNITVSAVWSFPRVFMQDNKEFWAGLDVFANNFQQMNYEISNEWVVRQVDPGDATKIEWDKDGLIDAILPNTNSVSWPLIFMWASVFRFNEYTDISKLDNINWKKITLSMSLKLLVILFYTIALMFLVVANIIRIWFLWIFIVLAPIIVIYLTFLKKWSKWLSQYFDVWSVLSAVFKPTLFVWYLSLMLIVLVLVKEYFAINPNAEIWWVNISTTENSSMMNTEMWTVEIKWNILKDTLSQWQSMFSDLFVFLLWIFLMWQLVKLAISDEWPIGKTMNSIWLNSDLVEWAMKTMPILPWWFGVWALRSTLTKQTQATLDKAWISWNGKWKWADVEANFDREWAWILEDKINSITWTKSYRNKDRQWRLLSDVIEKSPEKFWMESREIAQNIQGWLSISNYEWMEYFRQWQTKQINKWGFKSELKSNSADDIKTFFTWNDGEKNIEIFHTVMMDSWFKWDKPKTLEDLQKISYWIWKTS